MSSLQPTGSATGNPRNKTALAPGRSLMDWVRLCNSGKDMTGTKGALLNVSIEQLRTHDKRTDAWLAIRGIVYNITEYMSFHPGGEEELMKGAGTDATKLFNNVHPWVNYESLLKSCIVGRLKNIGSSASNSEWTDSVERPINDRVSSLQLQLSKIKSPSDENVKTSNKRVFKMDWFQQASTLTLIFYLKNSSGSTPPPQISLNLKNNKELRVSIEKELSIYELEEEVRWPCYLRVHQTVAELKFSKNSPKLWPTFGKKLNDEAVSIPEFCEMKVVHVSSLTHDTKLIALHYAEPMLHHVHVGHHIQIKDSINGEEVRRSYTPVSFLIPNSNLIFELPTLYFLIKQYNEGKLSHKLCSMNIGDKINMSYPRGTFNCNVLKKRVELILFAAGTGITPMTSLIAWTLNSTRLNIKLIYFNKTEIDILWRKQFDKLACENPRFSVTHVLSQPSPSWNGEKGLISLSLVKTILSKSSKEAYICTCGPPVFNTLAIDYLKQNHIEENSFHCFSG